MLFATLGVRTPFLRAARRALAPWATVLAAAACAGTASAPAAPAPTATTSDPPAVHWFHTAAEQRAVYEEVYRSATAAVERLSAGMATGSWGVILDTDETVLDNSSFRLRLLRSGLPPTAERWAAWVREAAAPALPGAVDFAGRVHRLGGRVVIVTDRDEALCVATRHNLEGVGFQADAILCRTEGESGKDGRFRAVQDGTAMDGLGPLDVLAWVGDNIHDFPGGTQALRDTPGGLAEVGVHWFVLPNPMYGSWSANPPG